MTGREYIEALLEVAHVRTISQRLQWAATKEGVRAELTDDVTVILRVQVTGPDTAVWESLSIYDSALSYFTELRRKDAPLASYSDVPTGATLSRIEELFECVYLAPRRRLLADNLAKVRASK